MEDNINVILMDHFENDRNSFKDINSKLDKIMDKLEVQAVLVSGMRVKIAIGSSLIAVLVTIGATGIWDYIIKQ